MVKFTTSELALLQILCTYFNDDKNFLSDLKKLLLVLEEVHVSESQLLYQLTKLSKKVEFHKIKSLAK